MNDPPNEPASRSANDSAGLDIPEIQLDHNPPPSVDESEIQFGDVPANIEVAADELPDASADADATFARVRPRNTKRSSRLLKLVVFAGLAAGIGIGSWLFMSFWNWQTIACQQVTERYQDHPIVVEKLGGIESCSFSIFETAGPDVDEDNVVAFKVKGPTRFGFIYVRSENGLPRDAEWAGLKVGKEFQRLEND